MAQMVKIDSPTGPLMTVTRVLAETLLAEHVISGDLDGRLHVADAATVKAAMMASATLCDFCGNAIVLAYVIAEVDRLGFYAGPRLKEESSE